MIRGSRGTADFLVIGAGIVGLTLALELKRRRPEASVLLLDKEPALARHASGRNSGVLHAGLHYPAGSLKARFCRDGNHRLAEYCRERRLPLNRCGKLVVARSEAEAASLAGLERRARKNGVEVALVTAAEAREIEPRVRTVERALWSPSTASVDPVAVVERLAGDARELGVELWTGTPYLSRRGRVVRTGGGEVECGFVINAAGLQADRVARDFGFSAGHAILPFAGVYLKSHEAPGALRTHVYPVPDPAVPFLDVHFTVAADGRAKIGPTARPALWREQYGGFRGLRWRELAEIARRQAGLALSSGFDFRRLALREVRKSRRRALVRRAAELVEGVREEDYREWGRPGIRAQLLDLRSRRLVMDFLYEGDERSLHVLNAVSPAFTCSLPLAAYLADEVERLAGGGSA